MDTLLLTLWDLFHAVQMLRTPRCNWSERASRSVGGACKRGNRREGASWPSGEKRQCHRLSA